MSFICMNHIEKKFGTHTVLHDVSLSVEKGQVVSIIGPSGSGKSTLLRCLSQLETIDNGEIIVDGLHMTHSINNHAEYVSPKELRQINTKMGMVFQHFNLFPHLTVWENLLIAPRIVQQASIKDIEEKASYLLNKVGLWAKKDVYPSHLSGGQQQRVAIARALTMNPLIMLFDEPTSALDPELTGEVLRTIRQLAEERMSMIIVTHEMKFARDVSEKVLFMSDGIIVEEGSPEQIFSQPKHKRTRLFLNSVLS